MKLLRFVKISLVIRGVAGLAIAGCWALSAEPPRSPVRQLGVDDLFLSTNLLKVSIEISEEGMETLRASRSARSSQPKPKAQATVREGDRVYREVTVQLKGFTSFRPVDQSPSLTLTFNKVTPTQKFHGLTKISLNNSLQDPTYLHEKFSRELFAAAGVPVPCADHAWVSLNGRELGLYVLTEGYDEVFLRRHFERTEGNLYEGGVLQDIDRPLQADSGRDRTNHAGVARLIAASREPEPGQRYRALDAALDLDRFLSMAAMETILCHSDSYSMNRNNYRLYHDPATDKIVFMPHGMDRILGTHRSSLDLNIVPPELGLVARALLSTAQGRRLYLERVEMLFTNLFQPAQLCRRVHEIDAKIMTARMSRPAERRSRWNPNSSLGREAEDLCARISERAADLKLQLADVADVLVPTSSPHFDANGVARIEDWKPRRKANQPDVSCETQSKDGLKVWHLRSLSGPTIVSLRSRLSLPAGSYLLTGYIKITAAGEPNGVISAAILRNSSTRFAVERQSLDWKAIHSVLHVPETRAPEEIELVCDIRDESSTVQFDPSSIRLIESRK